MLEILTDKSVCEREDFLFDVNSIFVDIEIKGTEFNREIVKTIDGGTFLSGTHFLAINEQITKIAQNYKKRVRTKSPCNH